MLDAFFDCFLLYLPEQDLLLTSELTTLGDSPGSVLQARNGNFCFLFCFVGVCVTLFLY